MDDIRTNIEKIFDQFTNDTPHVLPKRLSFDYLNHSFQSKVAAKRKASLDETNPDKKAKRDVNETTSSRNSLNDTSLTLPPSPWESRRMKADLIEAKAIITQLKQEIDQQNKIKAKLELMYNGKVDGLQKQVEHCTIKIADLEKHSQLLRKREAATKEDLVKTRNQLNAQKQNYEDKVNELERHNADLQESFRCFSNDTNNEINDLNRQLNEVVQNLATTQEELETHRDLNNNMHEKVQKFNQLEKELEEERQKYGTATMKIKDLEYEIASFGEWKEMSKSSFSRLSGMSELEKEVIRLRQESKNLRGAIGSKMLLEEQVYDLKTRLEKNEMANVDAIQLKVQVKQLEKELSEWKSIAIEHCPPNTLVMPINLRSRIEQILQKDLLMVDEKQNAKSEKNSIQNQLHELKSQNEIYLKKNIDLQTALKYHQNILYRAQKKLLLVAKERDCYKQLIENYEKDLTISGPTSATNPESQIRIRMDMLEKTVAGYKELCTNLERDLQATITAPEMGVPSSFNNEHYERLRKQLDDLRVENDKLKRRKDELELELEHRCLKGDFNVNKYKVVHMSMNPATISQEAHKNEMEKLQAEIERLKRKNRKLEEDHEEMTMRLNDTNMTINVKEVNTLRSQLQSLESKNQHLKEIYKAASQEFREVCYMLFGYRVDRVGNTNYRISSMYADSEEEYLNFRLNESGVLDMLETNYSISLADMMRTHLATHKSLPAFLSALTLELFNRTTITITSVS